MTAKIHTRGGRSVWQPDHRAPRHSSHRTVWAHLPPGTRRDLAAIRLGFLAALALVAILAAPRLLAWIAAWAW